MESSLQKSASAELDPKPRKVPAILKVLRWNFRNLGRIAPGLMSRLGFRLWFKPNRRPRVKPEQKAVLDRAEVVSLALGSETIKAYAWGDADRPAVFLMHGWEGRAAQLAGFVEPLLASGYRVVGLDAPGHGGNPKRSVYVHELTGAIQKAADELGPFERVITHSLSTVWTSVAMGTGAWPTGRAVCISPVTDMDPLVDVFSSILDIPPRCASMIKDRVNGSLEDNFWSHSQMNVPTLMIHDRSDDFIPHEVGEGLSAAWPDAHLHSTEGLGHRRILASPEVITLAVTFLENAAAARDKQPA